jgi:hypothetical protein
VLFWRNGEPQQKRISSSCRGSGPGPKAPERACRRQTVSKLCRRATSTTLAAGAKLSSMIRSFSAVVHHRRRSGPDRTVTVVTFALCLQINEQIISPENTILKAVLTGGLRRDRKRRVCKEVRCPDSESADLFLGMA